MKCRKCGGTKRPDGSCNLCELFAGTLAYAGVETARQNTPKESFALAVHPNQIPEAVENARLKGVPTDFTPEGRPKFESRRHQARYARLYGYHNRDGGYSD